MAARRPRRPPTGATPALRLGGALIGHALAVTADRRYEVWGKDADTLEEIGRELLGQVTRVSVRLPRVLAEAAVASWDREDGDEELPAETSEQWATRDRAATLSLIGLSIADRGVWEGGEVVVDLDAWFIGNALQAADDARRGEQGSTTAE